MHIVLFRNGTRALMLPADKTLLDCPPQVRHWLGVPCDEAMTELTMDTPMPGIHPPTVLAQLLQKGFCALDVYGVVQGFQAQTEQWPTAFSARRSVQQREET
nr:hypothetical protein [uncultured Cupriavidus sp.]